MIKLKGVECVGADIPSPSLPCDVDDRKFDFEDRLRMPTVAPSVATCGDALANICQPGNRVLAGRLILILNISINI